ncbi:S-adenosyl-L-methionine-dependent methyltransferase [Aspergillus coremiiformis]|uniref:S-adenosyl-L-methionine-dependent methyltransferase n=1 Tax=Aspergillus coremiiformis TaxID=138285 RepID=A0A5N6ZFY7_9EURO|nr:S-adenosyl-L-methionine-dependent methyltransferase [Aspergillus coremiiformis]
MAFTAKSPMEELAKSISEDVKILNDHLHLAGHPVPSFDRHTPTTVLPVGCAPDAHLARERICDHALRLFQLATGPSEYLLNIQAGYHYVSCLRWLCHFRIFHLVPMQGSISYADLAVLANAPERQLRSIVRMAMTNGLFVENPPHHLTHSATSALLHTEADFHDWAVIMSDLSAPTAMAMVDAHERWPNSCNGTQTAYNIAVDTNLPFFDHLAQQPKRQRQFAGFMRSMAKSQGTDVEKVIDGWHWATLGPARVVDVGGSTGYTSVALARKFPDLDFVVEDLPKVVAEGPKYIASLEDAPRLMSRIEYRAHSFFDPQPVQDADVYLLRMILHNWSVDDCVRILSHLVQAMKPGARIIIVDIVLPEPGVMLTSRERLLRVQDLIMMQVYNSMERQLDEWMGMFKAVDARLKVKMIEQPLGSLMSLIELSMDE